MFKIWYNTVIVNKIVNIGNLRMTRPSKTMNFNFSATSASPAVKNPWKSVEIRANLRLLI